MIINDKFRVPEGGKAGEVRAKPFDDLKMRSPHGISPSKLEDRYGLLDALIYRKLFSDKAPQNTPLDLEQVELDTSKVRDLKNGALFRAAANKSPNN